MIMIKRKRKIVFILSILIFILFISGAYTTWNRLDPKYTCAQCHEVSPSHARWTTSAHADVSCTECHGTALSDGYHSLSEKIGMVVSHMKGGKYNDDIKLTEEQALKASEQCMKCHRSEYAGWLAGGHAVNYREIFMDSVHNEMEKPYWDCFRCHGMFYEGNIHDLMDLESDNPHDWIIKDKKQAGHPTIPCLACHQIHTGNPVSIRYVSMTGDTTRATLERHPKTALYVRADKLYLRSDKLTPVKMYDGEREVESAVDPSTLLCMQCHSPNYRHCAGSEDDRMVTGVHEGISCIACHNPHSGGTRSSCIKCHPSLTDEQIKTVFDNPHTYEK
jgi:hypothetical protein